MIEKFQLFRLSLLRRKQTDLFYPNPDISRTDYLKSVFSESYVLFYRGSELHFKPDGETEIEQAILGRLGRQAQIEENLSPEEGLKEASHQGWLASVIVIDPSEHEDGQKASVQIETKVGKPTSIFPALITAINEKHSGAPFIIDAEPMFDAATFWEFAEQNRGRITSLTFEYVSPNGPWNSASSIKDGMKQYKEMTNANKVVNTLKSEEGLNTDNDFVKSSVQYAENGSGKIRARSKGGKHFSSTDKMKTVRIPDIKNGEDRKSVLEIVSKHISKVLGREQNDSDL